MLGAAAVAMWWHVPPELRPEWEDWHTREHMPERLALPGFLRGTRWLALSGAPSYFVLYEAASLAAITGGPYLERLNNPTPWSRRMMPHHRDMVRCLCAVRAGWGGGLARVLATLRFSAREDVPQLPPQGRGLTGAHLLESQAAAGETVEQAIRGKDASADRVVLIGGCDAQAVSAAAARFAPQGAAGLYQPDYSLSAEEIA